MRIIALLLSLLLTTTVVSAQRKLYRRKMLKTACQSRITQGVTGSIRFKEGNFMPGPGVSGGSNKPVQRILYVYKAMKAQREPASGGFHAIPVEKPLFKGISCADGSFTIGLPEGYYSLFVLENGALYASVTDGEGYLNPIRVEAGKVAEHAVSIHYKAVY